VKLKKVEAGWIRDCMDEKETRNIDQKNKQPDGASVAGTNLREEIARIVLGEDSDASLILGPHWVEREGKRVLVVRAFRPGAIEASLLWRGNPEPQAMTEVHPGGVFEAVAPASAVALRKGETVGPHGGADAAKSKSLSTPVAVLGDSRLPTPTEYRVQFRFADGNTWEGHDPYAFPPLLTEYDLYLSGEGTHYLKYGWARSHHAESRSERAVGTFYSWAGRGRAL
jgi:1,4-alpha-glucan branching enzyme